MGILVSSLLSLFSLPSFASSDRPKKNIPFPKTIIVQLIDRFDTVHLLFFFLPLTILLSLFFLSLLVFFYFKIFSQNRQRKKEGNLIQNFPSWDKKESFKNYESLKSLSNNFHSVVNLVSVFKKNFLFSPLSSFTNQMFFTTNNKKRWGKQSAALETKEDNVRK